MKEYIVTITETLKMQVPVSAASKADAEQMVLDAWQNSEYILDSDHFDGVEFSAKEKPQKGESDMSMIETEIWEQDADNPACLRYIGPRTVADVFRDLVEYLKKKTYTPMSRIS